MLHCKGGGSIIKDEEPDIGWQSTILLDESALRKMWFPQIWENREEMGEEETFPVLWPRIGGEDIEKWAEKSLPPACGPG